MRVRLLAVGAPSPGELARGRLEGVDTRGGGTAIGVSRETGSGAAAPREATGLEGDCKMEAMLFALTGGAGRSVSAGSCAAGAAVCREDASPIKVAAASSWTPSS